MKGMWVNWSETTERPQRWLRDWSIYCTKSGRAGSLQPGERKPRRDLVCISLSKNTAVGCAKKKESDFS